MRSLILVVLMVTGSVATIARAAPPPERVLGFESPTTDWRSPQGALVSSSVASEGSASLGVMPKGWTEVISTPLGALGQVLPTLSYDVRVPQTVPWGETRVILRLPSKGLWWQDLGGRSLSSLRPNVWERVTFALPSHVVAALSSSYSDLEVRVIINGPRFGAPYLLDRIALTAMTMPPTSPTTTVETFRVEVPAAAALATTFMSATDRLQIDDRVELADAGGLVHVAGLGLGGVELGADTSTHGHVTSGGNAFLRSRARVDGDLIARGVITRQDGTAIGGAARTGATILTTITTWDIAWPDEGDDVRLGPDTQRTLAPGSYGALDVHSRSVVRLRTGTYFFDSLNTEPQARLELDTVTGPVTVYVRGSFTYKGAFTTTAGEPGRLLVAVLGGGSLYVQAPFVGGLIAPNATIDLHRPDGGAHAGAFFGKSIHVYSDGRVRFAPLDLTTLCSLGDADQDGVLDCADQCPKDPAKSARGVCDCGTADTDSDGDGAPDCVDGCPFDEGNVRRGTCGCAGDPDVAPPGTPCADRICPGTSTCDGAGRCGGEDLSCAPAAGCSPLEHDDRVYWFCPPATYAVAEAACDSQPGLALTRIDGQVENAIIASNIVGPSWIGANDLSVEGTWRWQTVDRQDGAALWTGGPAGAAVDGRFTAWAKGEPGSGEAADCAAIALGGVWGDESCQATKPFVCEGPGSRVRLELVGDLEVDLGDFFPPLPGGVSTPAGPGGTEVPCTPWKDAFGISAAESSQCANECVGAGDPSNCVVECERRLAKAALDKCATCTTEPCATECQGAATPPSPDERCDPFMRPFRPTNTPPSMICPLVTKHPTATCTVANPSCPSGTTCGRWYSCHRVARNAQGKFEEVKCKTHQDCLVAGAAGTCGPRGVCLDSLKKTACDTRDDQGRCVGQCFSDLVCGTVAANCPTTGGSQRCGEALVCSESVVSNAPVGALDATSTLQPTTFVPKDHFPAANVPSPAVVTYPVDAPCPEGQDCRILGKTHPWCSYKVDGDLLDPPPVADNNAGSRSADAVKFRFDPNATMSWQASPGALGELSFKLDASVSLDAGVDFDVLGIQGSVDVLSAKAMIHADRCRLTTAGSKVEVFGHDFLPSLGAAAIVDTHPTLDETSCKAAVEAVETVVDRTKKAMRDAQELVRQYKAARAAGTTLDKVAFCALVADPPRQPDALFPTGDCLRDGVEATINRFISFYRQEAERAWKALEDLEQKSATSKVLQNLGGKNLTSLKLLDEKRREVQTLFQFPFFLGPIPATMEALAYNEFALEGGFEIALNPGAVASRAGGAELASVTASVTPSAGAGIGLFVAAGFSLPGLAVQAGIFGELHLGTVALPAFAKAGISVKTEPDKRALPEIWQGISSAEVLIPKTAERQPIRHFYSIDVGWGVSMRVTRVLAGTVGVRLKIEFLFFSKTWSFIILDFPGFDLGDVKLINGGAELATAGEPVGWGSIGGELPFYDIPLLAVNPGPPVVPGGGPAPAARTVSTQRVGALFFDSQCDCKAHDVGPCYRDGDCCSRSDFCFSDPAKGRATSCTDCRSATESCNNDIDCCDRLACEGEACVACLGHNVPCGGRADVPCCLQGDRCFAPLSGGPAVCGCVGQHGSCRNDAECCNSNCVFSGGATGTCIGIR